MFYNNNNFGGMNWIWWIIWLMLLFWIFIVPYDIPGQRKMKDSPIDILKKRFASGLISKEEFLESKKIIEMDAI